MMSMALKVKAYEGAHLDSVTIEEEGEILQLTFLDRGRPLVFEAIGDCCSTSWVEHLEVPSNIHGAVFLGKMEDSDVPWDSHECDRTCGHDYLQVYNTRFPTDRGDIVVEYRNDSNGYYGGWLQLVEE